MFNGSLAIDRKTSKRLTAKTKDLATLINIKNVIGWLHSIRFFPECYYYSVLLGCIYSAYHINNPTNFNISTWKLTVKLGVQFGGIKFLCKENISTTEKMLNCDGKYLQDITNLSCEMVHKLKLIAAQGIIESKFQTADQITAWKRVSTGCPNIDNILRGGIPINGITEIYGCSGAGKTQLCLQIALQVQINELSDTQTDVIFISTEDVFPSKRLHQLARAFNLKHNTSINFEDHIYLEHIADSIQLQNCLTSRLPTFLATKNVKLIVIDSIAGLFRSENENCNYASRGQEFKAIAKALNSLQDKYNLAVIIVNQVTDNIAEGVSEPCLGLAWGNHVTCRFCLSRNSNSPIRKFEVIFAPDLALNCTNIIIKDHGIINAE